MELSAYFLSKCKFVREIYLDFSLPNLKFNGESKSENLSKMYKETSTKFYKNGDYKNALTNCNMSIMNAPLDSDLYPINFANRSAMLYMLGKYEDCLLDIERALIAGYPDNLKHKLIKRKESCNEILSKKPFNPDEFENTKRLYTSILSCDINERIPCAKNNVQIHHNGVNKRTVIADEDINPGEVISVEKPFVFHLFENYNTVRCHNCGIDCISMIPCDTCQFVMFCNENCYTEAYQSFHRHICPFISLLFEGIGEVDYLSLYSTVKARSRENSWNDLWNKVIEIEKLNKSNEIGYTKISNDGFSIYDSKFYDSVHTLITEKSSYPTALLVGKAKMAALFLHFLQKYTKFFEDCPSEFVDEKGRNKMNKYIFLTGGLLLHNTLISISNPVRPYCRALDSQNCNTIESRFGNGLYPFSSLITHSCSPNLMILFKNNSAIMITTRPIQKGQELTMSYLCEYMITPYDERQKHFKTIFQGKCECEACANNWPLLEKLPEAPLNKFSCSFSCLFRIFGFETDERFDDFVTEDTRIDVLKLNRVVILQMLPRLCEATKYLENYAPSKQFAMYQITIRLCLIAFGNQVNLEDIPHDKHSGNLKNLIESIHN